jgi:DNA-binding transcriptional MerR regulator
MVDIPDKIFFKIGEVSKITGIKPYVLRYWESEFSIIRPKKNRVGQRVYTKKELERILEIKKLLYDERYSIAGAKKKILSDLKQTAPQMSLNLSEEEIYKKLLCDIKNDLQSLSHKLNKDK